MNVCAHCGKARQLRGNDPPADLGWYCSAACTEAWDAAHPEDAARWTKIEDLTRAQYAELLATIGQSKGQA